MRLILAWKQRFSLGVSSSERRDEVIKILRPMKASRFNLWPASHLVMQDVCGDLMTLKLHIMYVFCNKCDILPLCESWNHNEMCPCRWAALFRVCQQHRGGDCPGGLPYAFSILRKPLEQTAPGCSKANRTPSFMKQITSERPHPRTKLGASARQNSQRCGCMQGFPSQFCLF